MVTFGLGMAMGAWLNRGWNWYGGGIYYHGWHGGGWVGRSSTYVNVNVHRNVYVNNSYSNVRVNRNINNRNINTYRGDLRRDAGDRRNRANNRDLRRDNNDRGGFKDTRNDALKSKDDKKLDNCRAYALAPWEYFFEGDWDGDLVQEFAQKFISSKGQRDGLYWPSGEYDVLSPLGPAFDIAYSEGYSVKDKSGKITDTPYHGYHFKILKEQGPSAPGGRYNYIINGNMIGGFALTVFSLALHASLDDALYLFRRPSELLRSMISMNVITPLFAAIIAAIFNLHPAVEIALIALAVSPVPPALLKKGAKVGGHSSVLLYLIVNMIVSIPYMKWRKRYPEVAVTANPSSTTT